MTAGADSADSADSAFPGDDPGYVRRRSVDERSRSVDWINHPPHYTSHPSGIECIQIVEHMSFNLGNAVKYIWRADGGGKGKGKGKGKGDVIEDLRKAEWYIRREIAKRTRGRA